MKRTPGSTYRLQLHGKTDADPGFGFEDAGAIADYLKALGVTHVYSSPYLQAAPGSMHGYDVVDHRRVNDELGGAAAHESFSKKLGEVGLGQVLDIVPNHMSLGEQNRYWWDVLENGHNSRYASFFDIDWNSSEERLRDKVLVPILGDQYGRVLRDGGITLKRQGSTFVVEAGGQSLPAAPESLARLLDEAAETVGNDELRFVAASYGRLPAGDFDDRQIILDRDRDKNVLNGLLERLCREAEGVCEAIDKAVAALIADLDAFDEFLQRQHFRLAYWKAADQQLGYRRFFDVNTLIGLRVEREYVFEETHRLILRWLREGVLDGVRVDHPDGLRDPLQYFKRLRDRAPEAWIIGEKILEPGEWLRTEWPIQGTSGYDFLNVVLGTLVKPEGLLRLGEVYAEFTGDASSFPLVAHDKKLAVTQEALGSDVNRLADIFVEICESNREQRDFTRAEIRRAVREVASCFAIYRTYVVPDRQEVHEEDEHHIRRAIECAKNNRQDIDASLFDFMQAVLEGEVEGKREKEFVYRFQQFTSPVMAKGVEDTAFYCSNRLTAMNEVGGDPACSGLSLRHFHEHNLKMQATFPETMTTLSTHDTKRSDDVRARLVVLSECPERWGQMVGEWNTHNARYWSEAGLPDRGTEWFLYQTIVGAWPISAERTRQYMQKAMREAKLRTSWVANNAEYEDALNGFIDGILSDAEFTAGVEGFVAEIGEAGRSNSLAQTLLKCTSPGVPDLYQGGELWDFSLVDPDNRRPVDYALRRKLLGQLEVLEAPAILKRTEDGLPKLFVLHKALQLRNAHPEWFGAEAAYQPLEAGGAGGERLVAYLRGEQVLTLAPRWSLLAKDGAEKGAGGWGDTWVEIPGGAWTDELSGRRVNGGRQRLGELLADFPVALLVRERP